MRKLDVWIEILGRQCFVGSIQGNNGAEACFQYADSYLKSNENTAISVSLPLRREAFTASQTRIFFEGLLPEGFARRSVAQWMHVSEDDYLSILERLGNECLGAIRITSEVSPEIRTGYELLSLDQVRALAEEGAVKSTELLIQTRLSLTGASGKVGLYYALDGDQWFMPMGLAPSTHILKQSHIRLDSIVTNEQLSLMTAKHLGIEVPGSFIVETGAPDQECVLLASARYDRVFQENGKTINGFPVPLRLHQEDFAQALGIPAAEKYESRETVPDNGYLSRMFRLLRIHSFDPIKDQGSLWKLIVYNALLGNTDSHIKNHSLLYRRDLQAMRLAPAYDLLSTSVYESSTRDLAFRIGSAWSLNQISRAAFEEAAEEAGLGRKFAMKQFDDICQTFEGALIEASRCLEDQGFSAAGQLRERILRTGGCANIL
ncbi:MAG: HipA domain-containing protein [Eubacterium sp.]|nr:HipA domain-containing protein [Eubacterium sp.]